MGGTPIERFPIHLGLGAAAVSEPEFTGMEWYGDYAARHAGDAKEGRLVSFHRFTGPWASWEMHPAGDEVVLCLEGALTLHQEHADGAAATVTLGAGEYAINPGGTLAHGGCRGRGGGAVHHRGRRDRAPAPLGPSP